MKAGSRQNIHYGAPSWPYLTEPITAQNGGDVRGLCWRLGYTVRP